MGSIVSVVLLVAGVLLAGAPAASSAPNQAAAPAPKAAPPAPADPESGGSASAPAPGAAAFEAAFVPEEADAESPDAAPPVAPPNDPNVVSIRPSASLRWWEHPAFDRRVTLVLKDADLNTAIDTLGRTANMSLVASGGSRARKKVTLNLRNAPLRDVMLALANLYSLQWFRAGEVFVLTYVSASMRRASPTATGGTRTRVRVVPAPVTPGAPQPPPPRPRSGASRGTSGADPVPAR